jgi:putative aminopeptidase FrvX
MNPDSKDFLKQLVETASPSGYEHEVQKLVRSRIQPWCDTSAPIMGNVLGIRNRKANRESCSRATAIRLVSS